MSAILNAPGQRVGQKESITLTPDLGGETISDAVWSPLEGGLVISGSSKPSIQTSAFVQGDTPGTAYAKCVVTTSTGRVVPFVVKIPIVALTAE